MFQFKLFRGKTSNKDEEKHTQALLETDPYVF